MTAVTRRRLEIAGAVALAGVLTLVTFRAGRVLTFDGYHYCELAKQFTTAWPDRFGNHWPFGWPLAGGLLARTGVPAYAALVGLAIFALGLLLAGAASMLETQPRRWLVLAALAAAPVIAQQLGGVLTELPFAAALLGLALCVARWPTRGALWGAAACCVLALAIRYAGVIALAVFAAAGLAHWQPLRTARRLGEALAAFASAALVCALLLGLNVLRSGEASGAARGAAAGLGALPGQLADFGWSAPSALIAGGLRDRVGPGTPLGIAIGALIALAILLLCARAWWRPISAYSRPLALTAAGYCVGMAVLRCVGEFDALYNARTFLPAFAPLLLLTVEQFAGRTKLIACACAVILGTGAVAAARGISREVGGDVQAAVTALHGHVAPADEIAINDAAFSVAAYFPQRTHRVWVQWWSANDTSRFLIVAAKPHKRDGSRAQFEEDWPALCQRLVVDGRYRALVVTQNLIVLERLTATPQDGAVKRRNL